jgi:gluconokinase
MTQRHQPTVILLTGVSGSGKSTIGQLLADRLDWEYAEADDFHPAVNVAKMHAGIPLTDEDRMPWLHAIASWIDEHIAVGTPAVASCSALKRAYRDILRRPLVQTIYLDGDRDLIGRRMAARKGHFFPARLLDSQFRDLEPPQPDEHVLSVPIDGPAEQTVQQILEQLDLDGPRS